MKEIKAFVRPNKVNEIVHHLIDNDFENITLSSAEGTGKLQDENAFVSQKFSVTDSPMAKIVMVIEKAKVNTVVSIISEYGKTLNPGDGIIYVSNVEKAYRVKTGLENGEE
ncbi:MAG TPA: P-II family nitrogen regulator [Marinilabiliales bacterium]|jgi:nitrogen regulatory protein P-II 1|nr:P-II family nitrogen regulator [Bacteroidota bacterium]NCU31368.1 P-II family nitrogen regulator [Candidatus Moranbacteria bacterium]NSW46512.1 P-II family nitrogen regulator [Bacteroidales bacterium]OFX75181.1 MAG: transcriptional regulator [Bacteroidetes bacterium GWC1_47_7]HAM99829.1 P-II family nitrogen regulator [Marinilabiliales bacterium]